MVETPEPRRSFGAYLVEREIGRGGMGVVYEAVHEVLGRRAAIKVLLNDVSRDGELVERFRNEARAASAIEHPSIVKVYDVGHDDGAVYIVMELLPGESLASRLKTRGAMSIATAINFARQCAKALEAAHHAGIVHRDLKPDNVFLVPDSEVPGGERVKLLDFGVAKLVEPGASSVARTVTGAILGTPHYMSPEQCEGAREVDARSDLYSLGCMLFQMVTGRLPFQSGGIGGLIGMHLHVAPPTVASLRPDVPAELDALVARLLAKSPDDRPASATDVARALADLNPSVTTSSRGVIPELPAAPVDPEMPTVATVFAPTLEAARIGQPTAPSSPAARRWLWPLIGVCAVVGAAILIIASRRDDEPVVPPPERITRATEPLPDAMPVVAIDAAVVAPVIAPSVAEDPYLVEGRKALAQGDLDTARRFAAVVLKRDPANVEARALEKDVRAARAKATPTPIARPAVVPPPNTVTPPPNKPTANQLAIETWLREMETDNWPVVSAACRGLAFHQEAAGRINWERCTIAACKLYNDGATIISMAPQAKKSDLLELCASQQKQTRPPVIIKKN